MVVRTVERILARVTGRPDEIRICLVFRRRKVSKEIHDIENPSEPGSEITLDMKVDERLGWATERVGIIPFVCAHRTDVRIRYGIIPLGRVRQEIIVRSRIDVVVVGYLDRLMRYGIEDPRHLSVSIRVAGLVRERWRNVKSLSRGVDLVR